MHATKKEQHQNGNNRLYLTNRNPFSHFLLWVLLRYPVSSFLQNSCNMPKGRKLKCSKQNYTSPTKKTSQQSHDDFCWCTIFYCDSLDEKSGHKPAHHYHSSSIALVSSNPFNKHHLLFRLTERTGKYAKLNIMTNIYFAIHILCNYTGFILMYILLSRL